MIDNYEVVKKLIGDINPVGSTHVDEVRLDNLMDMIALVDRLMSDIAVVAENKDRAEHSMKVAGKHAHRFFANNGIEDY